MNEELYWLSRNGASAEGPFTQSQVISMWTGGSIAARDQLCVDGSEDWQPASFVMQHVDAALQRSFGPVTESAPPPPPPEDEPPAVVQRKFKAENGSIRLVLNLAGIIGIFFFIIPGLIFFGLAALIPSGRWFCGACGNDVGKNARLCGCCGARLN